MSSITAKQHEGTWEIRGFTRPYIDILKANQCAWNGRKLVWEYSGAGLPTVIQQIIDGTYGLDVNNPLLAPNKANSEQQVSEVKSPAKRVKRLYSGKDAGVSWKQAASEGRTVEWNSASGTFRGICLKVENKTMMRVLTAVGRVELVIPFELLRLTRLYVEADGTSPYMVENQRGLKPGQDWLGWMTCCECGVFLDLESNRKGVGAKALMGLPYGKVICPDCHRVKHNLPEIQIDESKAKAKPGEPQAGETWIWHHVNDSGWGVDEKIRVRIVQIKKRIQVEIPTKKGEPVLRWVERKSLIERIEPKPEKPTPAEMWWIDEGDNIFHAEAEEQVIQLCAIARGPFDSREEAEFVLQNGQLPVVISKE